MNFSVLCGSRRNIVCHITINFVMYGLGIRMRMCQNSKIMFLISYKNQLNRNMRSYPLRKWRERGRAIKSTMKNGKCLRFRNRSRGARPIKGLKGRRLVFLGISLRSCT
jgi:hypothetical protein